MKRNRQARVVAPQSDVASRVTRHASPSCSRSIRIIGLGNAFRGDDAVGLHVARRVKELLGPESDVVEAEMLGVEVLDLMKGRELVILVDGARTGKPAGTVHRWDVSRRAVPQNPCSHSTHVINALDALELGRALGELPPSVIMYGVEVGQVEAGAKLSPPVIRAAEDAARAILCEVEDSKDA